MICFGYLECAVGYIAQWLERLTADQQVPGSNPGVPSCIALIEFCSPVCSAAFMFKQDSCSAAKMDTLGIEPRASRMLSGCDTTTPCAP